LLDQKVLVEVERDNVLQQATLHAYALPKIGVNYFVESVIRLLNSHHYDNLVYRKIKQAFFYRCLSPGLSQTQVTK